MPRLSDGEPRSCVIIRTNGAAPIPSFHDRAGGAAGVCSPRCDRRRSRLDLWPARGGGRDRDGADARGAADPQQPPPARSRVADLSPAPDHARRISRGARRARIRPSRPCAQRKAGDAGGADRRAGDLRARHAGDDDRRVERRAARQLPRPRLPVPRVFHQGDGIGRDRVLRTWQRQRTPRPVSLATHRPRWTATRRGRGQGRVREDRPRVDPGSHGDLRHRSRRHYPDLQRPSAAIPYDPRACPGAPRRADRHPPVRKLATRASTAPARRRSRAAFGRDAGGDGVATGAHRGLATGAHGAARRRAAHRCRPHPVGDRDRGAGNYRGDAGRMVALRTSQAQRRCAGGTRGRGRPPHRRAPRYGRPSPDRGRTTRSLRPAFPPGARGTGACQPRRLDRHDHRQRRARDQPAGRRDPHLR